MFVGMWGKVQSCSYTWLEWSVESLKGKQDVALCVCVSALSLDERLAALVINSALLCLSVILFISDVTKLCHPEVPPAVNYLQPFATICIRPASSGVYLYQQTAQQMQACLSTWLHLRSHCTHQTVWSSYLQLKANLQTCAGELHFSLMVSSNDQGCICYALWGSLHGCQQKFESIHLACLCLHGRKFLGHQENDTFTFYLDRLTISAITFMPCSHSFYLLCIDRQ